MDLNKSPGVLTTYLQRRLAPLVAELNPGSDVLPVFQGATKETRHAKKDRKQPRRVLCGSFMVAAQSALHMEGSHRAFDSILTSALRSFHEGSSLFHARNVYVPDSMTVLISKGDFFFSSRVTIAWRMEMWIMPRSYRKRLWQARQRAA